MRLIRQPKRAGLMRTRMVGVMESKSQVYNFANTLFDFMFVIFTKIEYIFWNCTLLN